MQQIAVPVRPLPELQWTTITCFGSSVFIRDKCQLTLEPFLRFLGDFKKVHEGWSMVIGPVELNHSAAEISVFIVRCALRHVDDHVVVSMSFVQESGDLT